MTRATRRTTSSGSGGGSSSRYRCDSCFGSSLPASSTSSARPRISTESYGFSKSKTVTATRGSRARLRAFCLSLVIEKSTESPSRRNQTTEACGPPSGFTVATVAKFLPSKILRVAASNVIAIETVHANPGVLKERSRRATSSRSRTAAPRPAPRSDPSALLLGPGLHPAVDLVPVDVLDVGAQHPLVTERVAEASGAIAVELVGQRVDDLAAGSDRSLPERVDVRDIQRHDRGDQPTDGAGRDAV